MRPLHTVLTINEAYAQLQLTVDRVQSQLCEFGLSLNADKTKLMLFS